MAENLNRERSLLRFADESEDAASGLRRIRESLPRSATRITAIISELFAISSVLRQIHNEEGTQNYGPSFYRINDDLAMVFRTLRLTLDEIFDMFARSGERPEQMCWEDLNHRLEHEEGYGLLERLEWYRDFLEAQYHILEGEEPSPTKELKRSLRRLLEAQEATKNRPGRGSRSGSSTPRPRPRMPARPPMHRIETPIIPTVLSDDRDSWENFERRPPVLAPEPPPPISPTFTSSSSPTMCSSQTSYSSNPYYPAPTPLRLVHWAQSVFNGHAPLTQYKAASQLADRSSCHGTIDPLALQHLMRDDFQRALEQPFDEQRLWVRLYWRPSDHRARILVMTKDVHGQPLHYCQPLTNLKVIRNGSTLQLCRARTNGRYSLWARLNFFFHERMVLFYSTFVAMKRQDQRGVAHRDLVDDFELNDDEGEQELFAGQMKHGDMFHALRLFRDRASGVVRLEAAALRGPRKDVPIWTAFVTKYAWDADWAHLEGGGVVSFAAIRPPPSVFILRYEPPRNQVGNFVLPFTSDADAVMFMETWAGLCRSSGRHL